VTVPRRTSQRPRESWVATYQPCWTTASKSQRIKTQKGCAGKGCWPHSWVHNLSWGGPGATVGTLRTGYPCVQASSQDNGSRLLARGSSGATTCHLGSSTHLLTQDNSGAATCSEDGLCRLQVIKQISHGDPAIMISIGSRARVSSKALHDKGCSALSQGVHQMTH
jgi:hypothetical protein